MNDSVKNNTLLNGIVWTSGCAAIAVACYITKRATPLLAMVLIPKWSLTSKTEKPSTAASDIITPFVTKEENKEETEE